MGSKTTLLYRESLRALWSELSEVSREFVLYGGTALALHLAHRNSADFDLFGSRPPDLSELEQGISFLKGANIIQRDKNTMSAIVDRRGLVKASFFGVPLGVASLLDLAGAKASVVQVRAEAKEYIDIDALIAVGKLDLPLALSAAQRLYGSAFNPQTECRLSPTAELNLESVWKYALARY